MNLAAHVTRAAHLTPERPAVASGERIVYDWRAFQLRVARLAAGLRGRLGLIGGDRVALIMKNNPEYPVLMYALWHAGLAPVPVNAKLHPKELAYVLDHSQARLVFVTQDLAESVARACADAGSAARVIDVATRDYAALFGDSMAMVEVEADSLAWLFYTSGTTGRPKGAMISQRNLLAMATSYFIDIDPPCADGAIIHAAPLSHGSGLYMIPQAALGNCQVIPESGQFDSAEIFALLERWRNVTMFAAPTMINRLARDQGARTAGIENLRVIVWGGAPMYVADLDAAIAAFGYRFAQLYGQGESPMTITGMTRAMIEAAHRTGDRARLESAGVPQTVCQVRVADEHDRELPVGEVGEILVRGDPVMRGYWRNDRATAETLRNGWLHTGDMGAFDPAGFLTLKDRSKDLIISGGSNIYPREVEEVLLRHGGVAEVSVIGVPDAQWGEAVVAFVVARERASVDQGELDRLCLDHIARFKRPKHYRFIDRLPKSNYGKILKTELRAMWRAEAGR
jgi:long-chain acyl-CoA synthetase